MSKKLFFGIALCLFALPGWSQQVFIKPSVGLNYTNLGRDKSDNGNKYTAKGGFVTGASALIGKKFYVEPGFFYVRKNTKYVIIQESFDGPALIGTYQLSGFQVPVSVGYHLVGGESPKRLFGLRVFTGGSAFFLTSTDQSTDFNKTQWGVFGGLGIDLSWFFVEGKYEWTLTELQKQVTNYDLGRANSIYINLGVRIPVQK